MRSFASIGKLLGAAVLTSAIVSTPAHAAQSPTWKRIKQRGELVVSMDPANLPYSSAKPQQPGFDVELARALAEALGVKLRINWIDVQRETAIGQLLDKDCDLALGSAIDPSAVEDDQALAKKVIYSRPYYGTGYMLVHRTDGPHVGSLAELKGGKSRRLGAEAGSVADYRLRQRGYRRRLLRTQSAVLKSIHDGILDYGYLWANVGWTLHTTPEFDLKLAPGYVPEDHWNIAIAMRRGDDQLKQHVDEAVEKIVNSGAVARVMKQYHVPHFPPFVNEAPKTSGCCQPAVSNHEDGPKIPRRQRSKQGYSGLERIRSAGRLVVGLDQNNLPFSAAHPQPAGLDYEIAQLLAGQLGVSLQVYWAYSSHDSYPSKLASKKSCDLMLGVMPDDRFGQRVLYSKPYYHAAYQLAVSATGEAAAKPDDLQPLAVEPGIAVRGLQGRNLKEYPRLEDILGAVARGEVKAGYVISSRGHWLAQKHWPAKLKFLDVPGSVDKFPLCAAVRKTDTDLKTAVDKALDELARSGRLAEVFARWHIPYELR